MSAHCMKTCQLTGGAAQGPLLYGDTSLSFWGGVDPSSGEIIDRHHPLSGRFIAGQVLAIPHGRGSCTGSSVLLEVILNGRGPGALILEQPDEILVLGAIVAELIFGRQLPVVSVGTQAFSQLRDARWASLQADGQLTTTNEEGLPSALPADAEAAPCFASRESDTIKLNPCDQAILDGEQGRARQVAMQVVLRMAQIQGADELMDVVQAHIDGCIYTGAASLRFACQLRDWGGKVKIPTTLNSISVDQRRWRMLGVDPAFGEPASALAQAYVDMGASPSFTCAPYLLDSAPTAGQQIVWAESNAVVFANSVLGARTAKYADFLDICIALIGRAPKTGCHLTGHRRATLRLQLPMLQALDDAFYPLLGYWVGLLTGHRIPVICGLESASPSRDELKAFSAAFATTSSAPMFHIAGVTPEAPDTESALGGVPPEAEHHITVDELDKAWHGLNSASDARVDLVALGNPHFSVSECAALARLCRGRTRRRATALVLTTSRAVHADATRNGDIAVLEAFGVNILTDTCWCMLDEPIVSPLARVIMTNSGKYAHYAPGLTGRQVHFGSLADCVEAACTGLAPSHRPAWLTPGVPAPLL
ncbi:aconitase family protein [Polaromonas sp.]|uniref:cis-3-hydroxy-L-proline dehydratase n=1 Tax=Polaromonas sp. TaxID=1869339 RepID=UPI003262DDFB